MQFQSQLFSRTAIRMSIAYTVVAFAAMCVIILFHVGSSFI